MRFTVGDLVCTRGPAIPEYGVVQLINEGLPEPYRIRLFGYARSDISIVCNEDELCRVINSFVGFIRCRSRA